MYRISTVIALALVIFFLDSCASSPGKAARESSVNIAMMSQEELRLSGGGSTFKENPYLVPEGLIKGKSNEFIVLRADFYLATAATVEIQVNALDPVGASVLDIMNLEDMKSFWEAWPGKEADIMRRSDWLERTYIPSLVQKSVRGSRTWYLVFVGKNPIPRPTKVLVKAFIGESAPSLFEFDLPALPAKK